MLSAFFVAGSPGDSRKSAPQHCAHLVTWALSMTHKHQPRSCVPPQAKPDATVEVKISEDMLDVQFDFYK